jgi:autotransporter-associated beta strand protein
LVGVNTLSGAVTVSAGSLNLISGASLATTSVVVSAGGSLSVASGATLNTATTLSLDGTARFASPSVTLATLNGAATGTLELAGTAFTLSNGAFAGALVDGSGAGSLVKVTSGSLSLTGASTFSGTLTVDAGVLSLGGTGSLATNVLAVSSGGTLTVGSTATLSSSAALAANGVVNFNSDLALQTLTGAGRVNLNGTALTLGDGSFNGVLADGAAAAGSLVKAGAGVLTNLIHPSGSKRLP